MSRMSDFRGRAIFLSGLNSGPAHGRIENRLHRANVFPGLALPFFQSNRFIAGAALLGLFTPSRELPMKSHFSVNSSSRWSTEYRQPGLMPVAGFLPRTHLPGPRLTGDATPHKQKCQYPYDTGARSNPGYRSDTGVDWPFVSDLAEVLKEGGASVLARFHFVMTDVGRVGAGALAGRSRVIHHPLDHVTIVVFFAGRISGQVICWVPGSRCEHPLWGNHEAVSG
jgi:hypothetical protein